MKALVIFPSTFVRQFVRSQNNEGRLSADQPVPTVQQSLQKQCTCPLYQEGDAHLFLIWTLVTANFMVTPCISNVQHFNFQLTHTTLKNVELLKHYKISKTAPTCGNKMPTRCNRGFYCRSYCLLNMFRAPLCPSTGAQEYYTVVAACGISCCGFQVAGLVWS